MRNLNILDNFNVMFFDFRQVCRVKGNHKRNAASVFLQKEF